MALTTIFEDFGSTPAVSVPGQVSSSEAASENELLDSFDKGYRAGWDDAVKAKEDEGGTSPDALLQSLQDVSFTFHEVQSHVLAGLQPFFAAIESTLLPDLASASIVARVSDKLTAALQSQSAIQAELAVPQGHKDAFTHLMDNAPQGVQVSIIEVDTLEPGKATLTLGHIKNDFDLTGKVAEIIAMMPDGRDRPNEKEARHG